MRFLLDTNVISETMRPAPNRQLLLQLSRHEGQFGISVITWQELLYGVRRLPRGRRKSALELRLDELAVVLPPPMPVTGEVAAWFASERVRLEQRGVVTSIEDGLIAATAHVSNLTVVTANKRHFDPFLGLRVVDWTRPAGAANK